MRYLIILIGLMSAGGCGAKPPVDPLLAPYVDRFQEAAHQVGFSPIEVELEIGFEAMEEAGTLGECQFFSSILGEQRKIMVDRAAWDALGDEQREILMFHELGHCVLNREHAAEGIMRHTLIEGYGGHRWELVWELFCPSI